MEAFKAVLPAGSLSGLESLEDSLAKGHLKREKVRPWSHVPGVMMARSAFWSSGCIRECACTWVPVCLCAGGWGQKSMLCVFLILFSTVFVETGSLTELEAGIPVYFEDLF